MNLIDVYKRQGKRMSDSFAEQSIDVTSAIEQITQQTRNDLWRAIEEWENLLSDKSLLERVKDAKREREAKDIQIVSYEPVSYTHLDVYKRQDVCSSACFA